MVLGLVAGAADSAESRRPSRESTDLVEYLALPGDQVVTIPDGTYSGGTISAAHPTTDGPFAGWLILRAETFHGVTVTGDLVLEEGSSRVLFVGIRFVDSRVHNRGEQLAYWYTDHVFPDPDWYAAGRPIPRQFYMRHPGRSISLLGSDLHDGVASPINLNGVADIEIAGVEVYDLTEPSGSDPEDQSHLNVISLLGGATTDLTISDSYFRGARLNHQTDAGDIVGLTYTDVWYEGAFGSAFQFNATNGNRIVDGKRTDVRSWGQVGDKPKDRIDIIDGVAVPTGSRADRVDVVDTGVMTTAPPVGEADPATNWRQEHPYDSWREYFGWTDITEGARSGEGARGEVESGGPLTPLVLLLAVVGIGAATLGVRHRFRSRARGQ